jgi:hypothetical protein
MFQLYRRNGAVQRETFETEEAIVAGDAVYRELKRSAVRLKANAP